jgi:hypothetical protein
MTAFRQPIEIADALLAVDSLTTANSIATAYTGGRYLSSRWQFTNFRTLCQFGKQLGNNLLAGNMATSDSLSTCKTLTDIRLQRALSFTDKWTVCCAVSIG